MTLSRGPKRSRKHDITSHIGRPLAQVEKDLILATLMRCGGNRTWAADILGISILDLRDRLRAFDATATATDSASASASAGDASAGDASADETAEKMMTERLKARLRDYDPGDRTPS